MLKLTQLPIESIADLLAKVKSIIGIHVNNYISSESHSNFYGFKGKNEQKNSARCADV